MKNKQLIELVGNLNQVIGNQETKVAKKLFKIFEKVKPLYEKYNADVEELRLDNASTDKDGIPEGLTDFNFLEDWTTGIEFNKQEEEEL
jgi:hypothetical protein